MTSPCKKAESLPHFCGPIRTDETHIDGSRFEGGELGSPRVIRDDTQDVVDSEAREKFCRLWYDQDVVVVVVIMEYCKCS